MIEELRDYILTCPYLSEGRIGVDYLDNEAENYSISVSPAPKVIRRYIDGTEVRQIQFFFDSTLNYGGELTKQIENTSFYEDFAEWIHTNNKSRVLPDIDGIQSIECITNGYLGDIGSDTAIYRIQMQINYLGGN